jgi:hypothetical protein
MKKRKPDGIPNKSTYIPHPKIFKDGGKKNLENSKPAVNGSSYESSVGTNYHQPLTKKQQQETERISKELSKNFIQGADVVSDVMQLGNFIPHPVGQAIGKVGNVAGAAIDAYQAVDDFSQGDYTGAAINAASVALPKFLGDNGFKRNAKYLPKTNIFKDVNNRTMFNNVVNQTRHQTPEQLLANRALLGSLGAETIYDSQSNYKKGGKYTPEQDKMLSKIHQEFMYGNPAAIRMMNLNPPSYLFNGTENDGRKTHKDLTNTTGTHFMSSTDNFAVPYIQQNDKGQMYFNPDASSRDREAMRFNTDQEANYFGEHYKEVAPMMQQQFKEDQMKKTMKKGGTWNGDMSTFFENGGYVHPGFVTAAINDAIQNMLNAKPKKGSSVKNQFKNVTEFMKGGMFEDGGKVKHNFFDGDGNTDNQNEFDGGASAPEGAFNQETGQANFTPQAAHDPDKAGVVNPEAEASDAQNYNASQQNPNYAAYRSTVPEENEEAPKQKKGLGYAALGAIGAISGLNYVAKKRQQRQESEQDRMAKTTSSLYGNAMNPNGLKGDYVATGTAYGQFRPDQQTVYRQGMHYAKNGGMYQEGNEYELSETQIKLLEKMGYKLQY